MNAPEPILWDGEAVLEATGGRGPSGWRACGVSIDSRSLQPEDLFVALRGDRRDGHAFLGDAFDKGASAALVAPECEAREDGNIRIRVEDPLEALRNLAAHSRARAQGRLVAVTGSVGKTGIKDALGHVLTNGLNAHAHISSRSYNNHWGVPLSLARMPAEARYGIFEVGMNHAGEITPLSRLLTAHVALVSAVRPAHMEFFSSLKEVADAKAEIFAGLRPGGIAVLGRDGDWFAHLRDAAARAGAKILTFGKTPDADVRLLQAEQHEDASDVEVMVQGERIAYRVGIAGKHWVENSLAVLACCLGLGVPVEKAAAALATLRPSPGRGTRHRLPWNGGTLLFIDESYNANPASMEAALHVLGGCAPGDGGRRIAALGDMFELGENSKRMHAELNDAIEAAGVDLVFTCGAEMQSLFEVLPTSRRGEHFPDAANMRAGLERAVRAGDVLMVKGSNGMGLQAIARRFLDIAEAGKES